MIPSLRKKVIAVKLRADELQQQNPEMDRLTAVKQAIQEVY